MAELTDAADPDADAAARCDALFQKCAARPGGGKRSFPAPGREENQATSNKSMVKPSQCIGMAR